LGKINKDLNRLLARQLRKLGLDAQHPPEAAVWSDLLSVIDRAYDDADQDRYTLERSLAISSEEMQTLYQRRTSSYEARLRTLFGTIQDLIWLKNPEGVYLACNPMFERSFGATEAVIVGKTDYDFVDKELADFFRAQDRLAVATGGPHVNEEWVTFVDGGQRVLLETIKTPMVDASGQLIGVLGVARDITARRQAEVDLRIAAVAFESQEGMMITDAKRVILRVNRAFTEITGFSAEEAVGQTPLILKSDRHDQDFYFKMWASIHQTGKWQGEIWDRHKDGGIYPKWLSITAVKSDEGAVTHYVSAHTDITARKFAEDEVKHLAFYDPLTQLPNRRLLMDRLAQALASSARSARRGAVLFIDLDNFKTLNDTLGHDRGDLLLQQVAERLVTCVRDGDTVARLGGDEFVVLLEDLSPNGDEAATQTEAVGEKIVATLNQPYLLAGRENRSTPSIGVTLFSGYQAPIDELLKQADLAMYQSKAAGRNTLRFFDPQMQAVVALRAALEVDLRQAVRQGQFIVHYQPQVDGDGRLTGAEALVRWLHPQHGLVAPAEFIPLAEETGLIVPLGRWVLETACTQLARWAAQPNTAHLCVAVNVSANQLHRADFVDQVLAVLDATGANPLMLKLELTESLLVSDLENTIAKMNALKARGVSFSLDDFGTGYSSLNYLKRLPLYQLKVDRGFVRDILLNPNDAAIAKMIVALAESLTLEVIAEGVETEAQRDFLATQGCHAYQGYLYGRPLPLEEFEELMVRTCPAISVS
jgi:diguanylate cyclase (GGDEF)-like protein/PAS domain S-box-containing protein